MNKEELKGIILREKETSLRMSRVPRATKNEFVKFAEEEFANDFGMCFTYIWKQFKIWNIFFENIDMKLDVIINKLNTHEESSDKGIKLLSGRKVERR